MQITQVPSSERFGEKFHDALRRFDEERKLLNARFASARHTGPKD